MYFVTAPKLLSCMKHPHLHQSKLHWGDSHQTFNLDTPTCPLTWITSPPSVRHPPPHPSPHSGWADYHPTCVSSHPTLHLGNVTPLLTALIIHPCISWINASVLTRASRPLRHHSVKNPLPAHSALASPAQAVRPERASLSSPFFFHGVLPPDKVHVCKSLRIFSTLVRLCKTIIFICAPSPPVALISMLPAAILIYCYKRRAIFTWLELFNEIQEKERFESL